MWDLGLKGFSVWLGSFNSITIIISLIGLIEGRTTNTVRQKGGAHWVLEF